MKRFDLDATVNQDESDMDILIDTLSGVTLFDLGAIQVADYRKDD